MEEAAKSGELPGNDRSLFLFAAKTGFSRPQLRQLGDALALLLPLDEKIIADQTGYANAVMYSSCEMPVGYGACEIPVGYAIGKNAKIRKAEGSAKLGSVISTQKNANGLTALSLDFRIDFSGKLLRMPEFGEPAPLLRMFSDANLDFWVFYGWLAADLAEKYGIGRETLDAAFTSRNSYSFSIKTVPGQKFGLELEAKAGLHLTPVLKIGLTMKNPGGSLAMDGPPKMSFPALERTFSLESGCCGNMPPFDMSLN